MTQLFAVGAPHPALAVCHHVTASTAVSAHWSVAASCCAVVVAAAVCALLWFVLERPDFVELFQADLFWFRVVSKINFDCCVAEKLEGDVTAIVI